MDGEPEHRAVLLADCGLRCSATRHGAVQLTPPYFARNRFLLNLQSKPQKMHGCMPEFSRGSAIAIGAIPSII